MLMRLDTRIPMVSDSSSAKTAITFAMARPMDDVRSSGSVADASATL